VEIPMLRALSKMLNCSYKFREPRERIGGSRLLNGSYTGIIGALHRNASILSKYKKNLI